jgi:hypothetical protein
MRIVGKWLVFDDGETRPMVQVSVRTPDGGSIPEYFLVDIGADRTALSAALLAQFPADAALPAPPDLELTGISGSASFVTVRVTLELEKDDGNPVGFHGQFAAFTDPRSVAFSILGRDILKVFDVIVSQPKNEVLLLSQRHTYQVVQV